MGFDYEKYSNEIEQFLNKMSNVLEPDNIPAISEALAPVCEFFHICAIEAFLFDSPSDENFEGKGRRRFFYRNDSKERKSEPDFIFRKITDGGALCIYHIYRDIAFPEFDDFTKEKIFFVLYMLYSFNGRTYLIKRMSYLRFMDPNMPVYNINFILKKIQEYIEMGVSENKVMVFYNMKRFFFVNQQIGRKLGSEVLEKHALGLQKLIGKDCYVARIGGDNFLALIDAEILEVTLKYLKGTAIRYGDGPSDMMMLSTTAGVYKITKSCKYASDAMDRVQLAFNSAKNIEQKSVVYFEESLLEHSNNEKTIENYFPEALRNEEFIVYYQPKVSLDDYKLTGAEALCRWIHEGKLVNPDAFIPIIERTNAICKLDFYMLRAVCRDIRKWMDKGYNPVRTSVNISRRHMTDEHLVDTITSIVDEYKVPHNLIEIELTETTTDVDFSDLKRIVSGLQKKGFITAVDDFGMGYSSLNLIKELPWDVLKIDKSFLPTDGDTSSATYIMLSHVIDLVQCMGIECIVEGVETRQQVEMLKNNNCFLAQGFYFDRPLSGEQFEEKLRDGNILYNY